MKGSPVVLLAVLCAGLFLFGCLGASASGPSAGTGQVVAAHGGASTGAVKEFSVKASQFSFDPSTIAVKKGDRVRITLTSTDVAQGIAIPDFQFALVANGGATETGEFTADKAGTYTFFCNVFCGSGHKNMKGTLVVTE